MDATFMPNCFRFIGLFVFALLASCAAEAPKKPLTPLETYLAKADWYAGQELRMKDLAEAIVGQRHPDPNISIDEPKWIEEIRPFYDSAKAFAPENAVLLSEHWIKLNQCLTLGSTTVDLAQACKYELGAIRARITTH